MRERVGFGFFVVVVVIFVFPQNINLETNLYRRMI